MKLYLELLIGAAVGGGVYVVARHGGASEPVRGAGNPTVEARNGATQRLSADVPAAVVSSTSTVVSDAGATSVAASDPRDARAEVEQRAAMNALKNAIITSTSDDMHRRGADLLACTRDLDLAGTEKLRFAVHVDSSKGSADSGPWRFVEIVDGEALPDAFAACAERALGQGGHVTAARDVEFPEYRGDVELVYTIPAPR